MYQAVILAGGFAKRLGLITEQIPKALVKINDIPFVDWQLSLLARKGIKKVIFCVSHKSEMIESHIGDGSRFNLEVKYSKDGITQLGTGGAIRKSIPLLDESFMVLYGDSYLEMDYKEAETAFEASRKPAMVTLYKNSGQYDTSNIKFKKNVVEQYKKGSTNSQFTHIDYGLSFFKKEVFSNQELGKYFDLSEVFEDLSRRKVLAGYEVFNRFYEVGSLQGISDLSKYLSGAQNVI
jgi:N-acetyl-alpha-D-muramate 1-phosphate uridylyltransferase